MTKERKKLMLLLLKEYKNQLKQTQGDEISKVLVYLKSSKFKASLRNLGFKFIKEIQLGKDVKKNNIITAIVMDYNSKTGKATQNDLNQNYNPRQVESQLYAHFSRYGELAKDIRSIAQGYNLIVGIDPLPMKKYKIRFHFSQESHHS